MKDVMRLEEFEALAKARMDPAAFDYYAGGAADEITLNDNVAAFVRRRLRPRVLVDVSHVDTTTSMLGTEVAVPFALAPNAMHTLAHADGELATARAAAAANVLMCLSTFSGRSLEEVARAVEGPRWFQLYARKDRGRTKEMIRRVAAAGYRALILTTDLPVPGYRERELRNPVKFSDHTAFGNFVAEVDTHASGLLELLDDIINPALTWDDLGWIRASSDLPLVVKGILTAEDATLALDHGADAIVVSNHGGRQLDRAVAAIDALEEVVQAVGGRAEVYVDGGVRRGADVAIALALGARAVFVGRPYLYALAVGGQGGVAHCLSLLHAELVNVMALLGAPTVGDITRAHVV